MSSVHPLAPIVRDHFLRQPDRCLGMRPVVLPLLVGDFRGAAGSHRDPGHSGGGPAKDPAARHGGRQPGRRGGGRGSLFQLSLKLVKELWAGDKRLRAPRLEEGSGAGEILFIGSQLGPERGVTLRNQIVKEFG